MEYLRKNDKHVHIEKYCPPYRKTFEDVHNFVESRVSTKILPNFYITDNFEKRNMFTNCELIKKQFYNVEKKHAHTLSKVRKQREDLNCQWLELETKEKEFRKSFIYFDLFVKENEMKRVRAKMKFADVTSLIQKRSRDIAVIKIQIEEFICVKVEMDRAISYLKIFEVKQ